MKKKNNTQSIIYIFLILLFICTGAYSAYMLFTLQAEYNESKAAYDDLLQYVQMPSEDADDSDDNGTDNTDDLYYDDTADTETESTYISDVTDYVTSDGAVTDTDANVTGEPETTTAKKPTVSKPKLPIVDFDALSAINSDVTGWIYVEGTNINYPIVQGEDNSHYLHYTFSGQENRVGSIFMDYRCQADFSDRNTVIYGHRLSDKTMFTALKNYKKQSYYDAHPYYVIVTPEKKYVVEIFSGYVASVDDEAWQLNFSSDDEFSEWLADTKAKSKFKSKVTPTVNDLVVTLSTCTYEFDNARYVLFGILREEK